MASDTDQFSTLQIVALTAVGESDDLGPKGMQQTINSVMNRVAANVPWMGGNDARTICLRKGQYDCWWPQSNNPDRARILEIALKNPTDPAYVTALGLAASALAGNLPDITNGAVSYVDGDARADVHPGAEPCLVDGTRTLYDLTAVA